MHSEIQKRRMRSRQWRLDNPERAREHARRHHLQRTFGISLSDYDDLLRSQRGRCAICGTKDTHPWDYFSVDHDHLTGRVRGLLCAACNTCIGQAADDPERLRRAAEYLETR